MAISCNFAQTLFLDIECVPQHASYFDLDDAWQGLWDKKYDSLYKNKNDDEGYGSSDEAYEKRSGIYAEFSKIIVISTGIMHKESNGTFTMHVKSFAGDDEKRLLEDFFALLNTYYTKPTQALCGHNIKEFDIPFICRRALVHGLQIPDILDMQGKKPRENNHIDTMELWKFGDRKNFVSLDLLCHVLGVETPKNDISGEQVARVYRDDNDLQRIVDYCERDVIAVGDVLKKILNIDSIK